MCSQFLDPNHLTLACTTHDAFIGLLSFSAVFSLVFVTDVDASEVVRPAEFLGKAGPSGLPKSNSPILGNRFISGVA